MYSKNDAILDFKKKIQNDEKKKKIEPGELKKK